MIKKHNLNKEVKLLKDVCDITMGQSPDSSSYNDNKDGIPFFQGNADFGEVYPKARIWCNTPKKIANKNDILISVRAPIGALNYAKEKCCIGRGLAAINPLKDVLSYYIFYLLKAKRVELNSRGTGSTFKAISKTTLEELEIPIIDKAAQQKCVDELQHVDKMLSLRKSELEELDKLAKSRFVELFGVSRTETNKWGLMKLSDCCEINPKKGEDHRLRSGLKVSFVAMSGISENGYIDSGEIKTYDEVKTGFTYFAENDVLFAKITPCMENGKGAVARGLCNGIGFGSTEFHVLRPIIQKTNPYWIYTLTSLEQFRTDAAVNMTGSAGQRRVPASYLASYMIPLPPLNLQNQFAAFVQRIDKSKLQAAA